MEQVRQEHLSQFSRYLFQEEGGVLVTGSALKHHEQVFVDNLLAQTKAIIILDLDNTILHSTEISELDLRAVMALEDFYLIPKVECGFGQEKGKRDLIVVKMRPYFRQFIYVLSQLYEIYVYTKGTRVYAQEICRYIRAQYAGEQNAHPYVTWQPEKLLFLQHKKAFATNIISRDEDGSLDSKSFERILPTKTDYHLILDDRRDVWNNSPSWFFTREYYYFLSKTKRSQPDPADDIAHYLATTADIPLPEIKGQLLEDYQQIK
jgi:RNA polymerase II subunit A-like phosphatase